MHGSRVAIVGAVAVTLLALPRAADAMTFAKPARIAAVRDFVPVERVRADCTKEWNGYEWESRCHEVRTRHHYRSNRLRRLERRIRHYLRFDW